MNTLRRLLVPFVCAFVASPAFIILHEGGHFIAGRTLGWSAKLHFAESRFDVPKEKFTQRGELLMTIAGPLPGAILAMAGFLCLRRSRQHRLEATATPGDWVATTLILNAGRWLRSFAGTPSHPMPDDEAYISRAMGLPAWLLPYFLGLIAVVTIVVTIRLHPPGARCIPFLSMGTGGVLGTLLWMKVAGPFLLP